MIESIRGKIKNKAENYLILANEGIAYKIYASQSTLSQLHLGSSYEIYIDMVVREDDISLYGFISEDEREIYRLLTQVKGIGPRIAIGILSSLSTSTIINAIKSQEPTTLSKAPGVGKKTAERIILELKDKIDDINIGDEVYNELHPIYEAEEALVSLGYSSFDVIEVLKDTYIEGMELEELIRQALQKMSR